MSADGKLDLYAEDDISMHTQQISNLYCGGDQSRCRYLLT